MVSFIKIHQDSYGVIEISRDQLASVCNHMGWSPDVIYPSPLHFPTEGASAPSPAAPAAPTAPYKASHFCTDASNIVHIRGDQHGPKLENFSNIAFLWTAWIALVTKNAPSRPFSFTPADVSQLLSLMKKARTLTGAYNPDDYIDDIGYTAIAGEFAAAEQQQPPDSSAT